MPLLLGKPIGKYLAFTLLAYSPIGDSSVLQIGRILVVSLATYRGAVSDSPRRQGPNLKSDSE